MKRDKNKGSGNGRSRLSRRQRQFFDLFFSDSKRFKKLFKIIDRGEPINQFEEKRLNKSFLSNDVLQLLWQAVIKVTLDSIKTWPKK